MSHNENNNQQDFFRKKLARWLGISYDDLEEYAEEVECNNGHVNYEKFGYYLRFSDAIPDEISRNIKRLDNNYLVYFNLEELDAPK